MDERVPASELTEELERGDELERRVSRQAPSPSRLGRTMAAVIALAVAAAGLGLAIRAIGGRTARPASTTVNGRIAFSGPDGKTWQIYSIEPDGSELAQLTHVADAVAIDPAWSPDGTLIAYVVVENGGSGPSSIWIMRADGSGARKLATRTRSNWAPAWSPDGSQIAFAAGDPSHVYVVDADGMNLQRLTQDDGWCWSGPSWSPDGTKIVLDQAGGECDKDLYVMAADGSNLHKLVDLPGWQIEPTWSPDGATIAFTGSDPDGAAFGLRAVDADGANVRALTDPPGAQHPAWSPDGRFIAFMAPRPGSDHVALFVVAADGGEPHEVPGLPIEATAPSWQRVPTSAAPTPVRSVTEDATGVVRIDTDGRRMGDMIAAGGSLWVTLTGGPGTDAPSSLLRIDAATNSIVAEMPLEGCEGELAIGADALWSLGWAEDRGAILCRIDPTTNVVAAIIELPDGTLGPIVATDDAVWIAHLVVPTDGGFEDAIRTVLRIDLATNDIVATIPADVCTLTDEDCTPTWATAGEGAVWFEGYRLGHTVRVDPSTNGATTIETGASCGIAAGEGWAWVGVRASDGPSDIWNVAELMQRLDPRTGDPVGVPVSLIGGHPDPLTGTGCPYAAGAGGVWVVGSDVSSGRGLVARLDPETLEPDLSLAVADDEYDWPTLAFDFDAGILWLGRDGTLTKVSLK